MVILTSPGLTGRASKPVSAAVRLRDIPEVALIPGKTLKRSCGVPGDQLFLYGAADRRSSTVNPDGRRELREDPGYLRSGQWLRPSALWTLRLVVERFRLAVIVLVATFPDGRAGSRLAEGDNRE
jgi:hypothetical protein